MTVKVVVLGAGYAGAGAIGPLEDELVGAELTWISDGDSHLVLHEAHRAIRDPSVQEKITVPVSEIKSPSTNFIEAEVTGVDTESQTVELDGPDTVEYDYLLVGLGSSTAFYGIPGMDDHALTLKTLEDALEIHQQVRDAAQQATREEPAQVVVGGAGLSGIQSAGEIAEFRDRHNAPLEIYLIEALEEIFPPGSPDLQAKLRGELEDAGVQILTDDPITEAEADVIHFDERDSLEHDVFLWTGGVTGREAFDDTGLENEHNRITAESTFQTSEDTVFAIGDSAIIDQDGESAPPTAQAAWTAAPVAARNIANAINGRALETWTYEDKGTLISIGDDAVAHDVTIPPGLSLPVNTFGSVPAELLKKATAARWIATITSWSRAMKAWDAL